MVRTERIFKVHSGVRKRHTKLKRRNTPGRPDFVQRLAGGDVVVRRNRAATITESKLKAHLREFEQAYNEGRIEVRTPTGLLVDLKSLKVVETLQPAPPQAEPPLDSAQNDKPAGEPKPMYREGKALSEEVAPPPKPVLPGDTEEETSLSAGGDPAAVRKRSRKKSKE